MSSHARIFAPVTAVAPNITVPLVAPKPPSSRLAKLVPPLWWNQLPVSPV
ncbi:MAG: hypothetical protein ACXW2S_01245 [Telluria sp.]